MRTKYPVVAILLISCFTCLIASNSYAADRLYYGSWGRDRYASTLKDSLKFNIVMTWADNPSSIQDLAQEGLRLIAVNNWNDSTPSVCAGRSYYTMWEAEGFPGSNINFHYDSWGILVNDPSASGGKAMKFSGPASPRLIQWGPGYFQNCEYSQGDTIAYTAEFRLKYSLNTALGTMSSSPTTQVCSVMVVDRGTVLEAKTIYESDFGGESYQTFKLEDYKVPDYGNQIEFQIYWFGTGEALYIDYVKVYDENGWRLIDDTTHEVAEQIKAYVSQDWLKIVNSEGDTLIYRWYGKDEPFSIDYYMPHKYIDSLLSQVSQEQALFQAFCCWESEPNKLHEYLLRRDPPELCVDLYPTPSFGFDTTGNYYQQKWSEHVGHLNFAKTEAESFNKGFWLFAQAHTVADTYTTNCVYPLIEWYGRSWCPEFRNPSQYELRLQTFLGLCYGTDGILYFLYPWDGNGGGMCAGLYDQLSDSTTYKWREIRDFTGPRMKVLGPIYAPLEWKGACLDDVVNSFFLRNGQPSYIDSIRSHNSADEPHWVQVGFFENATADTSYFMLVNRECLETEGANYDVFVTRPGHRYLIRDMYTDTIVGNINGTGDHFTDYLGPGEGKLFKLEPATKIKRVPQDYPKIQTAINAAWDGDTVLVAPGHYHENISFIGKSILVASHFIFDSTRTTIDSTIIHGDTPAHHDTASVVRFIAGEDTNSVICGFTIRDGTGTKIQTPGYRMERGGGIVCLNSSPKIVNNVIVDNVAYNGGGIFCWGTRPIIRNNVIKCNEAPEYDPDIGDAGGIYITHATGVVIEGNVIDSNYAYKYGGGILITAYSESTMVLNNTIIRNWIAWHSGGAGAGMCIYYDSEAQIKNNIVVRNRNYAGIYCQPDQAAIRFNDVWGNPNWNFQGGPPGLGVITDTNNCGTPCDSFYNISLDPLFCDANNENYYLRTNSPCLACGENGKNIGALGWGCPSVGDANGDGVINIGDVVCLINYLYKSGPAPNPLEAGDVNLDGVVDVGDVVCLINYLFKNGPLPCE